MADFKNAQTYLLANEGGYYQDPLGGETYKGVTRKNFPGLQMWDIVDVHKPLAHGAIIPNQALDALVNNFYYTQFWCKIHGDGIDNQGVAAYLFDWYVNADIWAVKKVQAMLGITADGIFGNGSLNALNEAGDILDKLHEIRVAYYTAIGDIHPEDKQGWLNRTNNLYDKLTA